LIRVKTENAPIFIKQMGIFYQQQYHDFILDQLHFSNSTEFVLVLDSDTQAVIPILCQSMFNEYGDILVTAKSMIILTSFLFSPGKPYWTFWENGAPWGPVGSGF
jgi:hypothetical protein